MKILFTLDFPPESGGIQRYLHDMVVHTFGCADKVYAGGAKSSRSDDARSYPCGVVRVSWRLASINKKILLLPLLLHCIGEVIRHGPRLTVVAGNIYPGLVAMVLSLFVPLRYELYCYGTELLPLRKKRSLRRLLWSAALRRAATVYYLTNATKTLCELSGRRGPYVQSVPRIILPDAAIPRAIDGKRPLELLSVGRLVPHKGHRVLIEAVAALPAVPTWRCTIAGSGPQHRQLSAFIAEHALDKKITIETAAPDGRLEELYRSADILIHPSLSMQTGIEGFGIVLLEAMAYGAAVIASRSGGIEEVFDNNPEYAVLVPPGDARALREAMTALLSDHQRRRRMTIAARKFCGERYAWN